MNDVTESLVSDVFEAVKKAIVGSRRWPVSTYRLQFNRSFTFRDAAKLALYLYQLGITDVYASPYLKARPGSLHGYDIIDHNALNPEIGSWDDYLRFVAALRRHGMGHILDFVPNHMCIFDNERWINVLENGPSSPYSGFFDIDWRPVKAELQQKVLLPILEDLYGKVLESGELRLVFEGGGLRIKYHDHYLPVDPKTAVLVLGPCLVELQKTLGTENTDYLELQSIITACNNLPGREETHPERVSERQREKEIIKKRLRELCVKNEQVNMAIGEMVRAFKAGPGEGASLDRLHQLLEAQAYRLSYWRVAAEEINYRRFFDINELAALRMEDPLVFRESHRLVLQLLCDGLVTGIRVDHVDGLFDPPSYLWGLQRNHFLNLCRKELGKRCPDLLEEERTRLEEALAERFDRERARDSYSAAARPLFVLVEKILGEKETLRQAWPVQGTTGYEFAAALNGIFVDAKRAPALLKAYGKFTGAEDTFQEVVYQCKKLVLRTSMSAEVNVLAHQLSRISERSWWYRDFTLNSLGEALRETIACFPVYRTYIDAYKGTVDPQDRLVIDAAVSEAQRRNPAVSAAIFDFVRSTLLLQFPPGMSEEGKNEQRLFVMRFQQLTSPVMAKGVEDTAFYIYTSLVSLNEVGGHPQRFGTPVEEFHRQNIQRYKSLPHSMVSTSTHDSKRSEDVRARINVISEMPHFWSSTLTRWSRANKRKKGVVNGEAVPDRNEEYLIYQTLLGTYPMQDMGSEDRVEYCSRIQNYILKATREAKVHTSWVSPNTAREESVARFISAILDPKLSRRFLAEFKALNKAVAICGMYNSLAQTVLKIFSPGVCDIYQGTELWDFSLVDPDNRRPVDFARRTRLLNSLKKQAGKGENLKRLAERLAKTMDDWGIKLYVTWRALTYRRDHISLFTEGEYIPLEALGPKKEHICAIAWKIEGQAMVVVVPRLVAGLTGTGLIPPTDPIAWENTCLVLPGELGGDQYRNIFTGETVKVAEYDRRPGLSLAEVFAVFPVAALEQYTTEGHPEEKKTLRQRPTRRLKSTSN